MQTKQQMLASSRARESYLDFQRKGTAATICRGVSGDDFNFFYSNFTYWSDGCLGWIPDHGPATKICQQCSLLAPVEREFNTKVDINEVRKKFRDGDRLPRQTSEPSRSKRQRLRQLHESNIHRSTGNKDLSKAKTQKAKVLHVQKTKKGAKK